MFWFFRRIVVRFISLSPFLIAFYTLPLDFRPLAVCALVLKINQWSGPDKFEVSTLLHYLVNNFKGQEEGTTKKDLQKVFMFDDKLLQTDEADTGLRQQYADISFGIFEYVVLLVLIVISGLHLLR